MNTGLESHLGGIDFLLPWPEEGEREESADLKLVRCPANLLCRAGERTEIAVIKTNWEPTALTETWDIVLAWLATSDWNACPSSGRDMVFGRVASSVCEGKRQVKECEVQRVREVD